MAPVDGWEAQTVVGVVPSVDRISSSEILGRQVVPEIADF